MLIWILALLLFLGMGTAGYYMGALRSVFTFVGLIVGLLLAVPLGGVAAALFKIFGIDHPVVLAFLGPFAAYVGVLAAFKAGGIAVHRQVDTYYKYKASDTARLLFERMNSRIGVSLGLLNALVYLVALSVVIYMVGYFTVQFSMPEKDNLFLRTFNRLALDLKATRMDRAVAGFLPQAKKYYDGADVLGLIFHNPSLQRRLSTYPVFLMLGEKQEFSAIADSEEFQKFWTSSNPNLQEFRSQEVIKPLVDTREWYDNFDTMLEGDYADLRGYLLTGESAKYGDEPLLGRWEVDIAASFNLAKRLKPNMSLQEAKLVRGMLSAFFKDTTLTVVPGGKFHLNLPKIPVVTADMLPAFKRQLEAMQFLRRASGVWERKSSGAYSIGITRTGDDPMTAEAVLKGDKLELRVLNNAIVLAK
ncbi:MAG: hypothetical protein RJA22_1568 [Verrucomicrobiota bacterium]